MKKKKVLKKFSRFFCINKNVFFLLCNLKLFLNFSSRLPPSIVICNHKKESKKNYIWIIINFSCSFAECSTDAVFVTNCTAFTLWVFIFSVFLRWRRDLVWNVSSTFNPIEQCRADFFRLQRIHFFLNFSRHTSNFCTPEFLDQILIIC